MCRSSDQQYYLLAVAQLTFYALHAPVQLTTSGMRRYKASVPDDVIELCWQRLMEGGEVRTSHKNQQGIMKFTVHSNVTAM
jgi:hypothetical protein